VPKGSQSLESVIELALEAGMGRINTALPARVESYDSATQMAVVTPMLNRPVPSSEGDSAYQFETLPQIRDVRVIHPGGQDWALHIPLKAGDSVLLIVSQWDPSLWQESGEVSAPADIRPHSLAHAIALPGYRPNPQRLAGVSADHPTFRHKDGFTVTLKSDSIEVGGASERAALESKIHSELDLIQNAFSTFVPGSGGASFPNPYLRAGRTVGSTKLKTSG
jgi:hypothetical protein